MMSQWEALAVAKWEYVEKVKSKAFLISLFLMPIIMIGFGVIPTLLMSQPDKESTRIGIIDESGDYFEPLSMMLDERYKLPDGQPNYVLRQISGGIGESIDSLKRIADSQVLSKAIEGYIVIREGILTDTMFEYRSYNAGNAAARRAPAWSSRPPFAHSSYDERTSDRAHMPVRHAIPS